jgi:hypothetical protein
VDGVLETIFNIVPALVHDGPVSYMTRTYEVRGLARSGCWWGAATCGS